MDKIAISNITEIIKRAFDFQEPKKSFTPLSSDLIGILILHLNLLEEVNKTRQDIMDISYINIFDPIRIALEDNIDIIVRIISEITNRKIKIHSALKNDTVWKISKKYNTSISEVCELNHIRNIFSLDENKTIIVPIHIN